MRSRPSWAPNLADARPLVRDVRFHLLRRKTITLTVDYGDT